MGGCDGGDVMEGCYYVAGDGAVMDGVVMDGVQCYFSEKLPHCNG